MGGHGSRRPGVVRVRQYLPLRGSGPRQARQPRSGEGGLGRGRRRQDLAVHVLPDQTRGDRPARLRACGVPRRVVLRLHQDLRREADRDSRRVRVGRGVRRSGEPITAMRPPSRPCFRGYEISVRKPVRTVGSTTSRCSCWRSSICWTQIPIIPTLLGTRSYRRPSRDSPPILGLRSPMTDSPNLTSG